MSNPKKKILFIGGHATPAFAVLEELIDSESTELFWVGEKYNQRGNKNISPEFDTVTKKYQIPFIEFSSGKLIRFDDGASFFKSLAELFRLIIGFIKAPYILIKYAPNTIVSFGGFLAVPLVIWGKLLGKKIITHEQTITVGLANQIIAKFADVVAISWEETRSAYKNQAKVIFTGNPIRNDIFKIKIDETSRFHANLPLIYITCGNQGSHIINTTIFEILEPVLQHANVFHQTGNSSITNDYLKSIELKKSLPEKLKHRYHSVPYVGADSIGSLFQNARLIISRSGANTVSEQLAVGVPSILIPIPWTSKNEQYKNAKVMERIGLGTILEQKDLKPSTLLQAVEDALTLLDENKAFNSKSLSEVIKVAKESVSLDASKSLAKIILEI